MSSLTIIATMNDGTNEVNKTKTAAITTTGEGIDYRVVPVTTSEYTFTIDTDIGDAGYCMIINNDATNFVEVGFATTVYPLKVLAGQPAVFPLAAATAALYLKADTATCNVQVYVHEA